MSGVSYDPPLEDLAIFDPSVFIYDQIALTQQSALNNFLAFPVAQGTETFGDLISNGTANLTNVVIEDTTNITSTSISQSTAGILTIDNNEATSGSIVFKANNSVSAEQTILTLSADGGITTTFPIEVNSSGVIKKITTDGLICEDNTTATIYAKYEVGGVSNSFSNGATSYFDYQLLQFNTPTGTTQTTLTSSSLTFTNGVTTNTLDLNNWSGNINSVNTTANSTHFLGFFDSSATGYGKAQKTAGLSCNPSTNTITATTFSGSLSGNSSSSSSISLTSDNTAGTYFLPFSKTVSSNSSLFVDNTTTPLTYDPSTSTLTASIFNGSISTAVGVNLNTDDTNVICFIPFTKTATPTGNALFVDNVNGPLVYNPNSGTLGANVFSSNSLNANLGTTACNIFNNATTGSVSIMTGQTTGSLNLGSLTATTGVCNMRPPLVARRQIQTTTDPTYSPSVAPTSLGYTIETLGTAFTTTAIPSSANTNLMSYAFTSSTYGTYLFTAHTVMVPPAFTSNQAILAISNTSANTNTQFNDIQSPNVSTGSAYLSITCVIPIYSAQTIYLVGFFNGSTASVNNTLTHFTYTRIA